jgi:hypothetical protein
MKMLHDNNVVIKSLCYMVEGCLTFLLFWFDLP